MVTRGLHVPGVLDEPREVHRRETERGGPDALARTSSRYAPDPPQLRVQLVVADEVGAGGVGVDAALLEEVVQRVVRPVEVDAELDEMRVPQPRRRVRDLDAALVGIRPAFQEVGLAELECRPCRVMFTSGERVRAGRRPARPGSAAWLVWNSKSRPHWKRTSFVRRGPRTDVNRPITQSALTPSSPQLSTPRNTVRGRLHAGRRVPAQVVVAHRESVVVR